MTIDEFRRDINDWYDFLDFLRDNDVEEFAEDVVSDEYREEIIDEEITEYLRWNNWQELYRALGDIPTGYDYYLHNGTLDYDGLDCYDLDAWKDSFIDWINNEFWDSGEEGDESEPEEITPVIDEDAIEFDADLLDNGGFDTSVADAYSTIQTEMETRERERQERMEREAYEYVARVTEAERLAREAEQRENELFAKSFDEFMMTL